MEAESLSALKGAPCAHTILSTVCRILPQTLCFQRKICGALQSLRACRSPGEILFWKHTRISLSEEIGTGVRELEEKCENLVIVSDFVFSDGAVYDSLTELYIRLLGDLWKKIAVQADEVTEIVFGLPVKLKQRDRSSMRSAGN